MHHQLLVGLSKADHRRLRQLTRALDLSMSDVVRNALRWYWMEAFDQAVRPVVSPDQARRPSGAREPIQEREE